MSVRRITNRELADLPADWENPTVDTRKYCQCVLVAFEVDEQTFFEHREDGGLCQKSNERFYIA